MSYENCILSEIPHDYIQNYAKDLKRILRMCLFKDPNVDFINLLYEVKRNIDEFFMHQCIRFKTFDIDFNQKNPFATYIVMRYLDVLELLDDELLTDETGGPTDSTWYCEFMGKNNCLEIRESGKEQHIISIYLQYNDTNDSYCIGCNLKEDSNNGCNKNQ